MTLRRTNVGEDLNYVSILHGILGLIIAAGWSACSREDYRARTAERRTSITSVGVQCIYPVHSVSLNKEVRDTISRG